MLTDECSSLRPKLAVDCKNAMEALVVIRSKVSSSLFSLAGCTRQIAVDQSFCCIFQYGIVAEYRSQAEVAAAHNETASHCPVPHDPRREQHNSNDSNIKKYVMVAPIDAQTLCCRHIVIQDQPPDRVPQMSHLNDFQDVDFRLMDSLTIAPCGSIERYWSFSLKGNYNVLDENDVRRRRGRLHFLRDRICFSSYQQFFFF
uniref:Uncharacterized protein n=1 Tax=Angiostrongylus cantonensis TaxID=6313 RepID=A0A0K0D4J0_ANGCA